MKRQPRKNANQRGFVFKEERKKERRLVLGGEELALQRKHLPRYQC